MVVAITVILISMERYGKVWQGMERYGRVRKGMAGYGGVYGKAVVAIRALSGLSLGSDNVLMPTSQL